MKEKQKISFTGILIKGEDNGYTAYIAEFPEIIAEGETEEDAKYNLFDAFRIMLEFKKESTTKDNNDSGKSIVRNFELEVA